MNRPLRRKLVKNHKLIDILVRDRVINLLKNKGIDFVMRDGNIVSGHSEEVTRLLEFARTEVVDRFAMVGGNIPKLRELYKYV